MEVKAFTDSMFLPLMVQRESFDDYATVAYNLGGILNIGSWIEDESGLCYIPDLIKICVTFDGDINDIETFDQTKAEIFSIVATTPPSFIDNDSASMTGDENTNMLKNIMNCFSGTTIGIPEQMKIFDDLLEREWSYRVETDKRIYPCVIDGALVFECL